MSGDFQDSVVSKFSGEYNSERIMKMGNIRQSYERMYSGTVFLTHCVHGFASNFLLADLEGK